MKELGPPDVEPHRIDHGSIFYSRGKRLATEKGGSLWRDSSMKEGGS